MVAHMHMRLKAVHICVNQSHSVAFDCALKH